MYPILVSQSLEAILLKRQDMVGQKSQERSGNGVSITPLYQEQTAWVDTCALHVH